MTAQSTVDTSDASPTSRRRPLLLPWWLLIGFAGGVVGMVPWLITGMRLPLQNLWATETLPDQMPIALLPFSQYALTLIAALIITGGAAAGIATRAARSRLPRYGFAAALFGLLLVQVAAATQAALVVRDGLQERSESTLYLGGLIAVTALAVVLSTVSMVLIGRAAPAGAVIGASIAALLFGQWVGGLVVPFGSVATTADAAALSAVRWIPAVLIGVAIAWAGLTTIGRSVAAGVSLLALWIVPALITAVTSAAGSRVLAGDPRQMMEYAREVFVAAFTIPGIALPPVLVAAATAGVGLLARHLVGRSR